MLSVQQNLIIDSILGKFACEDEALFLEVKHELVRYVNDLLLKDFERGKIYGESNIRSNLLTGICEMLSKV